MSINKHVEHSPTFLFVEGMLKTQVLGQIKLCGISVEKPELLEFQALCDILNAYHDEQLEVSKRLLKSFPNITEHPSIPMLKRMRLVSEAEGKTWDKFEQALLEKAKKYNIPHNLENPDFITLEDDISEYEFLLKEANEYGISWDVADYDPAWLKEAIEEAKISPNDELEDLRRYYNSTRL